MHNDLQVPSTETQEDPLVPQPPRLVKIATMRPQEPETAENIMLRLGRRSIGEDGRRFIISRGRPGDHTFWVDAGEGTEPPVARDLVVEALDHLARDWRDHLIVLEPETGPPR